MRFRRDKPILALDRHPAAVATEEIVLAAIAAFVVTVVAVVYAGLAPFEFEPSNQVEWLRPGPGLRVVGDAIAYSDGELRWPPEGRALTLELWLKPHEEPRTRLARILSLVDEADVPLVSIDQWGPALIVRDRFRNASGQWVYREHTDELALRANQPRYLAVTSDASGTVVYIDGAVIGLSSRASVIGDGEEFRGQLVLLNSARGRQEWMGEIYGVAIYARALEAAEVTRRASLAAQGRLAELAAAPHLLALYPLDDRANSGGVEPEDLSVGKGERARNLAAGGAALALPAAFVPLRRGVLSWPQRGDPTRSWYRVDLLLNVLGFLPVGFFAAWALQMRSALKGRWLLLAAAGVGAGLSLCIELVQVLLPSRVSTLTDLAGNTLGAVLGCAIFLLLFSNRISSQS